MSKSGKYLNQLAARLNLKIDDQGNFIFGNRMGYEVIIPVVPSRNEKYLRLLLSLKKGDDDIDFRELEAFVDSTELVRDVCGGSPGRNMVMFLTAVPFGSVDRLELMVQAVDTILQYLRENGYQSCCQECSSSDPAIPSVVGGMPCFLCDSCYGQEAYADAQKKETGAQKQENLIRGIVGAFLGSLIGVACIIFVSRLGYVSTFSGVVMALCTLKGYELSGRKMSIRGVVISCVIMLVMTYIGNQINWAVVIAQEMEMDLFTAFRSIGFLLQEGVIEFRAYYGNLFLLYGFSLAGGIFTVIPVLRDNKQKNITCRLHNTGK